MSRTRYRILDDRYPYFMTGTIVAWLPIFSRPERTQIIFNSWKWLQSNRNFMLFGYVIMENHLHFIASSDDLSKDVKSFKSYTAKLIIEQLEATNSRTLLQELEFFKKRYKVDSQYQVWQEGNHPQEIQNEEIMRQKLEYMHYNPVKRGFVDDPVHWRYSSARNYAGMEGLIDVQTRWL